MRAARCGIAGVLFVAADRAHRHLVDVGVEVAADDDECVGIRIEQTIDQQPYLESLAGPLHRRDEKALGPAGHGPPCLRVVFCPGR